MKDDIKSDLDTIFRTHQEKKENAQKLEEEKGRREEEFLSQFYLHQKTTIRPAMEAIGKYVSEKGYSYRIDESKDEITHDVKRRGPRSRSVFSSEETRCGPLMSIPILLFSAINTPSGRGLAKARSLPA